MSCLELGLFGQDLGRFSAEGDGEGRSAYLMKTGTNECDGFTPSVGCVAWVQHFTQSDRVADIMDALRADGVIVVQGLHADDAVSDWKRRARTVMDAIRPHLHETRVHHFDNYQGHAIVHSPERVDVWPMNRLIPIDDPPLVVDIIQSAAAVHVVKKSVGLLPIEPNCRTFGKWHRDTSPLFHWPDECKQIPDYYFTSFLALDDCGDGNGATEFVVGSHRMSLQEAESAPIARGYARRGDVVIMNGKLIHRGTPNLSPHARDVMYTIWCAPWFDEEVA